MTAAEVVTMRTTESETESPRETPSTDSIVRTKSELEEVIGGVNNWVKISSRFVLSLWT